MIFRAAAPMCARMHRLSALLSKSPQLQQINFCTQFCTMQTNGSYHANRCAWWIFVCYTVYEEVLIILRYDACEHYVVSREVLAMMESFLGILHIVLQKSCSHKNLFNAIGQIYFFIKLLCRLNIGNNITFHYWITPS